MLKLVELDLGAKGLELGEEDLRLGPGGAIKAQRPNQIGEVAGEIWGSAEAHALSGEAGAGGFKLLLERLELDLLRAAQRWEHGGAGVEQLNLQEAALGRGGDAPGG